MESIFSVVLKICFGRFFYGVVWCMWEYYLFICNVFIVVVVMVCCVRMLRGLCGGVRFFSLFVNIYFIMIVELIKLCWVWGKNSFLDILLI